VATGGAGPKRRVAVLGASQATGFGLEVTADTRRRDRAFPALLNASPDEHLEVMTFARNGWNMDDSLRIVDEAIALRPDIVVCIGGGRESLVRRNPFVERCRRSIPVRGIAHTPRYHGVERVKTVPWQVMVWLLNRDSAPLERLAKHVGFGPEMDTAAYAQALGAVVDRILAETSAHLFLVRDFSAWQGEFAWWSGQRAANRAAMDRIAAGSPRITTLSALGAVPSYDEWLPDGAHLSEAGHARAARWLANEIRAVTGPVPSSNG
jgi:lysophospholipase L1-like esterase